MDARSIVKSIKALSKREKKEIRLNYNTSDGFFGASLDHEAPIVLCDCIAFLRNLGFYETGVFRVPGNLEMVETLKNEYNRRFANKELKEHNGYSILNLYTPRPAVNDVASLMKTFFLELPEPLIKIELARAMFGILKLKIVDEEKNKYLTNLIKKIPCPQREVLGLTMSFLRELIVFRDHNQMSVENVATVFVFSVFGKVGKGLELQDITTAGTVIKKMLRNEVRIFMPTQEFVKRNTRYQNVVEDRQKGKLTKQQSNALDSGYGKNANNLFGGL